MQQKLIELKEVLGEVRDLHNAAALLSWDQETYMPKGSMAPRSEQLATLHKIAHEKFTSDEVGSLLETLTPYAATLDPESEVAAIVRVTNKDYKLTRKLPTKLVIAFSRTTSQAIDAWRRARTENKFSILQPHLVKLVDLNIQKAEAWGYEDHIYDALLDEYEPDMKTAQIKPLFNQVKEATLPLVQAIAEAEPVEDSFLALPYNYKKQWDFTIEVMKDFGFDFEHGRQDISAHPFTTSFGNKDVRVTTSIHPERWAFGFFATLHECGHGLYEQGILDSLQRTGLDQGASLGIHESQSRLWEHVIGHSHPFWEHYYPRLQKTFPDQLGQVSRNTFYRAINKVQPSFIRTEADEVTYNLHIFIRFEIEQQLVTGQLKAADLPAVWNDYMQSYLGIVPDNDKEGVLQDIHWAGGSIGYFPTYALGNILSVQFFNQLLSDKPETNTQIAAGQFGDILSWLKTNIHQPGRKYTPAELVQRVTGGPMDAQPFITYINRKCSEIYGL